MQYPAVLFQTILPPSPPGTGNTDETTEGAVKIARGQFFS